MQLATVAAAAAFGVAASARASFALPGVAVVVAVPARIAAACSAMAVLTGGAAAAATAAPTTTGFALVRLFPGCFLLDPGLGEIIESELLLSAERLPLEPRGVVVRGCRGWAVILR